jgi:hypothetical protein
MDNINEIRNRFEQELVDNGYKFFKDSWKNSLRGIQKKFEDQHGVKYFLTVYHYNHKEQGIPTDSGLDRYLFTSQFRLNKDGKDQTVDIDFSADFLPNPHRPISTLSDAENFFDRMFVLMKADYYEPK